MRKLLHVLVGLGLSQISFAQVTGITVETIYTDDGSVVGYPVGHKTFRVYANLTNPTDRLTAVYGDVNAPFNLHVSGNGVWNHNAGGTTAFSNECLDQQVYPSLEYDSFLAIGYACNEGAANTVYALNDPNVSTWINETFDFVPYGAGSVEVNTLVGALWFGMKSDLNTQADNELRVLIAQITTDGEISGVANFQVFPEYTGVGSEYIEQEGLIFGSGSGCGITISTTVTPPTCFGGQNASIQVNASGGNGPLEYSLDNVNYGNSSILNGVGAGSYVVYVQDETNCVSSVDVEVTQPAAIVATSDVSLITCHDSNDGSIHISHTGGVGMLVFSLDGLAYLPSPDYDNLPPGTYTIHISDMNNCTFASDTPIILDNPEEISVSLQTTDVTCHGMNNGVIEFFVDGGIEPYEFNIGEGYSTDNPLMFVPFGTYDAYMRDARGCIHSIDMALVAEPTAIEVSDLSAVAITENIPGGNTTYTVTGGIFPYTFQWTDEDGNVVSNSENLPQLFGQAAAGVYTLTVIDLMGCTLEVDINVSYVVSVEELTGDYSLIVYPNPTTGIFTLNISTSEAKNLSYSITDMAGRVLLSTGLFGVGSEYRKEIDLSNLSAGVYLLETKTDKFSKTVRLIKM